MTAFPAATGRVDLRSLLTQLQHAGPRRSLQAQARPLPYDVWSSRHADYLLGGAEDEDSAEDEAEDEDEDEDEAEDVVNVADYPARLDFIGHLIHDILGDAQIHLYPELNPMFVLFQEALMTFRSYQPQNYEMYIHEIELVYNQMVAQIKSLYTFENTGRYEGDIAQGLNDIMDILSVMGYKLHFVKFLEVATEQARTEFLTHAHTELEALADLIDDEELAILCQQFDTAFTAFNGLSRSLLLESRSSMELHYGTLVWSTMERYYRTLVDHIRDLYVLQDASRSERHIIRRHSPETRFRLEYHTHTGGRSAVLRRVLSL